MKTFKQFVTEERQPKHSLHGLSHGLLKHLYHPDTNFHDAISDVVEGGKKERERTGATRGDVAKIRHHFNNPDHDAKPVHVAGSESVYHTSIHDVGKKIQNIHGKKK